MSNNIIQTSFNAGEWAPALNARVDLGKYHSGAALLRNFFVDYRGGATTRPGTRYVLQAFKSATAVRLIPFQASFTVSYVLEFGDGYIRFFNNGAPILENPVNITAVTNTNPASITIASAIAANNDWFFISGVVGMTQLNGNYYIAAGSGANFGLHDLFGTNVDSTGYGTYISGGTVQRVYTITSPYAASELAQLKFTQNVNQLIICHPNHPPYILTLVSSNNWTLAPITFGPTIAAPAPNSTSTLAAGSANYAYIVTSVDGNGQESAPSAATRLNSLQDLRTTPGSNSITWAAITGAISYNIYKAEISYSGAIAAGALYGFIGNVTGTTFIDSNITPDFSQGVPVVINPFAGAGVAGISITAVGLMGGNSNIPGVTLSGGGGSGATAQCTVAAISGSVDTTGFSYNIGDTITLAAGVVLVVTGVTGGGGRGVASFNIINAGSVSAGSTPGNSTPQLSTSGSGLGFRANLNWGLATLVISNPGTGYTTPPAVSFTANIVGAAATTSLGASSAGNPTVPGFIQQRLILCGPVGSPSQMNLSQPGAPFNYNVTFPTLPDDAIQETLTNTTLNSIKSVVPVSAGLITLTDKSAWLINGGSPGAAISALSIVANSQGYSGAADLPPITTPTDILYVQAKGSIVRDLAYNFYLNNYVGVDISILSSHLFYGFTIKEWAWAEEPFKTVWAVRNDGQLLSLCFVKDQQMIAWAHSDTLGLFSSIASVTESTFIGNVDAIYHCVRRNIRGQQVQYIERFVELSFPQDYKSSWQVDAGIGYSGTAKTTFSGAQHLGGQVVTGVADGAVINFTMPISGTFVFGPGGTVGLTTIANASIVTVGLSFLPQLQTLALDLGEPTVQGKRKKVSAVTVRCNQTLGLSAGRTFSTLVPMKDLSLGNVGTMSNQIVAGLQTTDARTIVDPQWDVFGQFCIQQSNPYPASILGVIPEIEVGDSVK